MEQDQSQQNLSALHVARAPQGTATASQLLPPRRQQRGDQLPFFVQSSVIHSSCTPSGNAAILKLALIGWKPVPRMHLAASGCEISGLGTRKLAKSRAHLWCARGPKA